MPPPTEANPDRDRAIGQLTSEALPHASIFWLEGDEHFARVDGIDSPIWDFAGLVKFNDRCGRHGRDGGVILIES
jgi:hypothetical protein